MKHIGHIDSATTQTGWKTHSLGMLSPHDLFIPNPGERENVSADQWTHVGWVDPDKDGGRIWTSHAEAGDNSRPAYVQREAVPTGMIVVDGPVRFVQIDPTDVRRSEFNTLTARFDNLENIVSSLEHAVLRKGRERYADTTPSVAADQPMTFYDHAFIHAAVNHADYYAGVVLTPKIIDDAHAVASMLTRNRANKP